MREAEASGRRLVIIDKGKSYVPLKAMFGEGSTQIQLDRTVVINPNEADPRGRVD